MVAMAGFSDNQFDLAIVDPPYGINVGNDDRQGKKFKASVAKRKNYGKKDWDTYTPPKDYFLELKRVSKHQIIWGVNYYEYDLFKGGRIYWDKVTAENYSNSDGELAYCSKINSIKSYRFMWNGMLQGNMKNKQKRIHPTQKPIQLYEWLLMNYAKEGDKILDTHLGSGSIAIACHNLGYDLTGYEIDTEYYEAAIKRLKQHQLQLRMF